MSATLSLTGRFGLAFIRHNQLINSAPARCGHWFSNLNKRPRKIRPLSHEVLKKYNETVKEQLPEGKTAPALLRSFLDDSVPDSVQKIYSFEHMGIEAAIEEVIADKLQLIGLHPSDDSTAAEIVQKTVMIRMMHENSSKNWNKRMERNLLQMIADRDNLVKRLRSEDYAMFLTVLRKLKINFSHEEAPHIIKSTNSISDKLVDTQRRCQQLKQLRLKELEQKFKEAEAEFQQRRDTKVKEAEQKLKKLNLPLSEILNEVYSDRRDRAEESLINDRIHWFYAEQYAKRNAEAKLREKARAAAARGRK